MHQVRPAIVLRGGRRRAHVFLSIGAALMALWALGSLGWLVVDLLGGATGVFESRGSDLPLWAVLAVSTLVASYATWDTSMAAVMTGPGHGVIDHVVEPAGIRLRRLRTWGRAHEVLVQRGETVQIGATLAFQRRGGLERHYRFTVSAPGGAYTFTQAIHIEQLSLEPLDAAAREMGIRVETSGEAVAMERLGGRPGADAATPAAGRAQAEAPPRTREAVATAAATHLSAAAQSAVQSLVRPSWRLRPTLDAGAAVGRLGGPAMLAAGTDWPTWQGRGLEVVAVLDLARLPELPGLPLPRVGWLTFFYDVAEQSAWGFDPTERDAWRVIHAREAEVRSAPGGTETLPEVGLAAVEELTVPDPFEDALAPYHAAERAGLLAFGDALPPVGEPAHRVGGWPDLVQGSMWLGAQLASNGVYVGGPEGYEDPRAKDLAPGAGDWRLLLQVDTDDDAAMMWGDAGRLYYLVRDQDLAAGAFDRCWFELQCY